MIRPPTASHGGTTGRTEWFGLMREGDGPSTRKDGPMYRHGTITQIDNQGTIVQVWMRTDEGRMYAVNFDHRPFWHMIEARGVHRILGFGATYRAGEDTATLHFDHD
jgi:hypothetical protein